MVTQEDIERSWQKALSHDEIGEFMTTDKGFPRPGLAAWNTRSKIGLIGTARSTYQRPIFRPFDLLAFPNQSLTIVENDHHRIGAESVIGVQEAFHRYVDTDMIYFQFSGSTTIESEFGVYTMEPGEVLLMPNGTSHRSTGKGQSLRYFCQTYEPIDYVMDDDQYTGRKRFAMNRVGGPDWGEGSATGSTNGVVIERMHRWDDGPDDMTIVERDPEFWVGAASLKRGEQTSGVKKIRAFDHYRGVVGKDPQSGMNTEMATQYLLDSPNLRIRTYNMEDEQFAFHRGLRSEEFHLQFRGYALDINEFGRHVMEPGTATIIPRGISHSVISVPPEATDDFLRLNFYSSLPWKIVADVTQSVHSSTFEVETEVVEAEDWRKASYYRG
jgi:mannose-6-phosphate isomerase-like protein (cupin superfamily)